MKTSLSLILILAAIVGSGCLGDQSREVTFKNETSTAVTLYPYGRNRPQITRDLAVGVSYRDHYPISGTEPTTLVAYVEAVDASGRLVFCHRYTVGELDRLGGQILIREGDISC